MDVRKCLFILTLCLVAGVLRGSNGVKLHKFEVKVASLEHAKQIAMILERSGTYKDVLTIKYIQSSFCLGKRVILVVSTDDTKYFGDGVTLKDGVRPELKWTEDALGKLMSMVLEIKYYSYENVMNEDYGIDDDDGVMSKKMEEIVKVRFDKIKRNVSSSGEEKKEEKLESLNCNRLKQRCLQTRTMFDCNWYYICMSMRNRTELNEIKEEKDEETRDGVECAIMKELCRAEEDVEKREIICKSARELCKENNDDGKIVQKVKDDDDDDDDKKSVKEMVACLVACLVKCIIFGSQCVATCVTKCRTA